MLESLAVETKGAQQKSYSKVMQQIGGKYKGACQSDLLRIRKDRILFRTYDPYNRKIAQTVPVTNLVVFQSALNTLAQIVQSDRRAIPLFSNGFSELFQIVAKKAYTPSSKPNIIQALFLTTDSPNPVTFNFGTLPMVTLGPIPQQGGDYLIVTDSPRQYFTSAGPHVLYITGIENAIGLQLKRFKSTITVPPIPSLTTLEFSGNGGGEGGGGGVDNPEITNTDFRGFLNLSMLIISSLDFSVSAPILCSGMSLLQSINLVGIGTVFDLDISNCPLLTNLDVGYSRIQRITTAGTYPQLSIIFSTGSALKGTLLDDAVTAFTGKVDSGTWTSDQAQPNPFLANWTWNVSPPSPIIVADGGIATITAAMVAGYTHFSVTLIGSGGKGGIGGGGGGGAYILFSGLLSDLAFPLQIGAGEFSDNPNLSLSLLTDANSEVIVYAGGGTPGTSIAPGKGGIPSQYSATSAPGQDGTVSAGGVSGGNSLGVYTEYGTGGNPPDQISAKGGIVAFMYS